MESFQRFTGYQYLQIDVANHAPQSLDKLPFKDRIRWTDANDSLLLDIARKYEWKKRPLYLKAVFALRQAQQGKPVHHLVAMDAVCSGIQVFSVLTGCFAGAQATGLLDPHAVADAYTLCTDEMSRILGYQLPSQREMTKVALMTVVYGSQKEPEAIFGKDTPELAAFYEAAEQIAPGAMEALQILKDAWNPRALGHGWKMPDGFDVYNPVTEVVKDRIRVPELNSSFEFQYTKNKPLPKGVNNAANVAHSTDAYVLRCLVRRCMYDADHVSDVSLWIQEELLLRTLDEGRKTPKPSKAVDKVLYYRQLYRKTRMADIVIVPWLIPETIALLDDHHLSKLNRTLYTMQQHEPFPLVTVHDDFKCHPNNMNYLREHYRDILAELAESETMDYIVEALYDGQAKYTKIDADLGDAIRANANYMLS